MQSIIKLVVIGFLMTAQYSGAQELYQIPENTTTGWSSFENPKAEKGEGGKENKGAKGHAFNKIRAGESIDLLNIEGSGVVNRIWMTFSDRSPEMLRSLVIEMYWDQKEKPAVSVPIGDFFGIGLGKRVPFESVFFTDPEGRSFNCYIPMPFKTAARIVVRNESDKDLGALFYDINFNRKHFDHEISYFHAYWNREMETELGKDFEILPKISGKGRFLGTNIGLKTAESYEDTWFGEGEVKMYIDGDSDYPSLVGSGTEDYIGTAYGQGAFSHQFQGSPIADAKKGLFAFYRYHHPDPVYFYNEIRVTIQQIGGAPKEKVLEMADKGVALKAITIDSQDGFVKLLEGDFDDLEDPSLPDGWTNFYRSDDVSATAYFYLDKPVSELPALQKLEERLIQSE
ncbi:MAG: glycoside hydrolase family 172 protein [Bacteroidota bacterium]|nr:hypothetical protein [Christiangramia sp.]MEE2772104.1 glycoside hydrolase family 172 protein [Bacteroidota bacterium]